MSSIEVRHPVSREVVGRVREAEPEDFRGAVCRAREAQRKWNRAGFAHRAVIVRRFHDLLIDRTEEALDVIQSETAKTRRDAFTEIATIAGIARYYLSHGAEQLADRRRDGAVPAVTGAEIVYKPLGVVGLITPWNYPFLLPIGDAIPALLAGNAVVLKPSELTPLACEFGKRLFADSGLDSDLFAVLHGGGAAGAELIRHVDYVGFTGGTSTGRKIAVAAGERLIPFSLELGGKNPMIVLEGASIEDATNGLIAGAFSNAGQTCISVERIYVQNSIFENFARAAARKASALKLGCTKDWSLDVGSLITDHHADKVMDHIGEAERLGAKVLAGGRRRLDLGSTFVEPTILTDVPESAAIRREETFGPVVALYPVRDAEEAIEKANDSAYGLNASIWTGGAAASRKIARHLETGSAVVNSTLLIYNSFDVPMGGVKQSGVGRRHGDHGIQRYTQEESIVSSLSLGGGYDSLIKQLDRPSRAKLTLRILRWWRRLA